MAAKVKVEGTVGSGRQGLSVRNSGTNGHRDVQVVLVQISKAWITLYKLFLMASAEGCAQPKQTNYYELINHFGGKGGCGISRLIAISGRPCPCRRSNAENPLSQALMQRRLISVLSDSGVEIYH